MAARELCEFDGLKGAAQRVCEGPASVNDLRKLCEGSAISAAQGPASLSCSGSVRGLRV